MKTFDFEKTKEYIYYVGAIGYIYGLYTAITSILDKGGTLLENVLSVFLAPIGAIIASILILVVTSLAWHAFTEKIDETKAFRRLFIIGSIIGLAFAFYNVGEKKSEKQNTIEAVYEDGYNDGVEGEHNDYYYDEVYTPEHHTEYDPRHFDD